MSYTISSTTSCSQHPYKKLPPSLSPFLPFPNKVSKSNPDPNPLPILPHILIATHPKYGNNVSHLDNNLHPLLPQRSHNMRHALSCLYRQRL